MFGKDNDSRWAFKENNMSNGLLAMYIFLAIFATGLVIYSKMEDWKEHKE